VSRATVGQTFVVFRGISGIMGKITIFALAALAVLSACKGNTTGPDPSTGTLTVVVTSNGGAAVAAATVRVDPGARTALTDAQGTARFANLAAGDYTVTVQASAGAAEGHVSFQPPSSELRLTLSSLTIIGGGVTIQWGAPESLRVAVVPAQGEIVWVSTRDFYLSQPVELGRGSAISTAPLRPGTTTVEARHVVNSQTVETATTQVTITYRESWNMDFLGLVPLSANSVADVWVQGRHALVARRGFGGISIIDIDAIEEVGRFADPGMHSPDVDAENGIAYVANEPTGGPHPFSVTILDITDPTAPRQLGGVPKALVGWAHTVFQDGTTLYIANPFTNLIHVWDVADPAAPRELSTIASTAGDAHDMHVRNGIFYGAYMQLSAGQEAELTIANVADPAAPAVLARVHYPNARLTHSTWPSEDGRHLFLADEVTNAAIRIFDVSNPANPVLVATYQPRLGTVPHHFQVNGDLAYLSHYKNGVEVIDVSDPTRPHLVGFYDTHPGAADDGGATPPQGTLYHGAWGVHWTDDGKIVVSDMERGLFVLRFRG
jgi:choice-of-anchor B domain-containing protein